MISAYLEVIKSFACKTIQENLLISIDLIAFYVLPKIFNKNFQLIRIKLQEIIV